MVTWVSLLRGHAGLRRIVATQLHEEHELTVNEYEALLLLDEAPARRLRGVDLAAGLQLTPSGVTRLLEGLRARGYIERAHCPKDGRVAYAVLLDAGRAKLRQAACSHVATISALLDERYSEQELRTLAALLARLPGVGCAGAGEGEASAAHNSCPQSS
jgi:DNA-binding MarR family transcriptional regulator